ncbi:unnamed protein product [Darwinula stevensoni]|uniref:ZP domain-containing protein n=1 Tax=Darwinula stevensoni TaxID=69355 RepID=A0A7R8X0H9_9CRUS|nr:unnamed protein product [Darwinula stevensoni]CAG0881164.1 unnamed protein product [Darwinula stevensoni]
MASLTHAKDGDEEVAVVEGVPVEEVPKPSQQVAQDRDDHGGHHHHGIPDQLAQEDHHGGPPVKVPAPQGYGAPPISGYAPPRQAPRPVPIPVPLPVPVSPATIVLPQLPQKKRKKPGPGAYSIPQPSIHPRPNFGGDFGGDDFDFDFGGGGGYEVPHLGGGGPPPPLPPPPKGLGGPPPGYFGGPPPPPIHGGLPPPPPGHGHGGHGGPPLLPHPRPDAFPGPQPGPADPWPLAQPEMPKIVALDVKCEKNLMKVSIQFDKPFHGIIFSKGHYSNVNCVHLPAGLGRTSAHFDISINACGTSGNTQNGLYGYGTQSGAGTYFENTIVIQYDPQVQEVWDQARKLRCTWHDQYEKAVTFRPFPVDMLEIVRADFAGDNVGCWMQIQVGKGPWASEVSGLVKIGQTMTMVLAIKDDDNKFDMLVRNCMAHDGKRAPIQLVDQRGCVTRPKLMSRFTKIKNFGASASVLSYAHFQVVTTEDLAFELDSVSSNTTTVVVPMQSSDLEGLICMSTPGFAATLIVLLAILIVSCLLSAFLCIRYRAFHEPGLVAAFVNPVFKKSPF